MTRGARPLPEACDARQARRALDAAGVVPPHAFIRGLDQAYDLDVLATRWFADLAPQDDFRIVHGEGDCERWVVMQRLPWDSEFFGRGIARLDAVLSPGRPIGLREDVAPGVQALEATLDIARTSGISEAWCTVDATNLPMIRTLGASGFDLIETRCQYHITLAEPAERHATRLARPDDVPSLARAARESVNMFDRFHADPAIDPADADRLMVRWVEASILEGFADATVVPDVQAPEAFCTARYHREHWEGWGMRLAQPVLSAVSPKHRGWYVRILSEVNEHLRTIGATHAFLVTQLTNNAVIRCWEKLGFQFGKGEHVFRLRL